MRNTWDFYSTERIVFGNGAIGQLDVILQRLKAKNILLVTDYRDQKCRNRRQNFIVVGTCKLRNSYL